MVRAPFPRRGLLAVCLAAGAGGCARLAIGPALESAALQATATATGSWTTASDLPSRSEVAAGQLVIHADFPLAEQHRIVRDLEQLRVDVSQTLDMPISDEPVHLYLFESPQRYEAFVARQFPAFPARRAFFVETDTTLAVFAAWQDRVAEDLRHETTHGYVHAVVPTVPLWLDEGIAEFFEVPRADAGLHRGHVAHLAGRIIEGTWRPDLQRMESLASAGELSQDHYAEAWCWVHWLLRTTPERRRLLQDHLAAIRRDTATPPLSLALRHVPGIPADLAATLRGHVEELATAAGPH
jgi:hypothetical protein